MPRTAIDYSKTIIYKLVCNDVEVTELYVGSTTNFRNRKNNHKSKCHNPNSPEYEFKVYQFIRANGGFQNWSMIVLERYPCNDKLECSKQERLWIEILHATLNKQLPLRTHNESNVNYYQNNKEIINKSCANYYQINKEKINRKKNTYHACKCGCKYTYANKAQHHRSPKHIDRINLFETVDSFISEYQCFILKVF